MLKSSHQPLLGNSVTTTLFYRLIDESPRWLWAQGRKLESIDIVDKAVKINRKGNLVDRKEFIAIESESKLENSVEDRSHGILDLFSTRKMRTKSLNVCLSW